MHSLSPTRRPFGMSKKTTTRQKALRPTTRRITAQVFHALDYATLGSIYCDYGGLAFWQDRKGPCQQTGLNLATVLKARLPRAGRSLYVGAGVAELPPLIMETTELDRAVAAYTLRTLEAETLNAACREIPFRIQAGNARRARGTFDHVWMVSVLNDPDCYPETSALSYGRANPVTFNALAFSRERAKILRLTDGCLQKLASPGLVTTSVEEIPWVTDWCRKRRVFFHVEKHDHATALVGDPICFIHVRRGGQ